MTCQQSIPSTGKCTRTAAAGLDPCAACTPSHRSSVAACSAGRERALLCAPPAARALLCRSATEVLWPATRQQERCELGQCCHAARHAAASVSAGARSKPRCAASDLAPLLVVLPPTCLLRRSPACLAPCSRLAAAGCAGGGAAAQLAAAGASCGAAGVCSQGGEGGVAVPRWGGAVKVGNVAGGAGRPAGLCGGQPWGRGRRSNTPSCKAVCEKSRLPRPLFLSFVGRLPGEQLAFFIALALCRRCAWRPTI